MKVTTNKHELCTYCGHQKKVKEAKKKYISIKWHTDDILECAKDLKVDLTINEANGILDEIKENHDCTTGVTWEVIDCYIDMFLKERQENES